MRRLGFQPWLLVALGVVLLGAGAVGALALAFMDDLNRRNQDLAGENIPELALSARLAETVHAFRGVQFRHIAESQPTGRERLAAVLIDEGAQADRLAGDCARIAGDAYDREAVTSLGRAFARYRAVTGSLTALGTSDAERARATALLTGPAEPIFLDVTRGLRELQDDEQAEAAATAAAGQRAYERYRRIFTVTIVAGILLLGGLGLWLLVARPLRRTARMEAFRRRLRGGLELAEDEQEALDVAGLAIRRAHLGLSCELLLADSSDAHMSAALREVAPGCPVASCGVESPRGCAAVRRGRLIASASGEEPDACPRLRGRPDGPCSAVCTPVNVLGRTVGVLHAAGPPGRTADEGTCERLEEVAEQVGARLGVMRAMARSRLQASTDPLTGLLNRRSLEEQARALRGQGVAVSVAMADLDHFKRLNDTHGHDTGDRALRTFARVLREAVRQQDLVCRYGGEEFVLVLPRCSAAEAAETAERVRAGLRDVVGLGGIPEFTCSFGVAESAPGESLEDSLRVADATLLEAKRSGRDQVRVASVVRPAHHPLGDATPPAGAGVAADRIPAS